MNVGTRLAKARQHLGISQASLAAAMGKNYTQSMISNVECGRRGLLADGWAQASRALGVSVDYLLGLTDNPNPQPDSGLEEGDAYNVALIPELSRVIPSGEKFDNAIRDSYALPKSWLLGMGIDPRRCFFIRFQGDSMLPEIPGDSRLVVDRGNQMAVDQKVYLLESPRGTAVKRVHPWQEGDPVDENLVRGGGRLDWVVRSDNRVLDVEPLTPYGNVKIIGQVKWLERSV